MSAHQAANTEILRDAAVGDCREGTWGEHGPTKRRRGGTSRGSSPQSQDFYYLEFDDQALVHEQVHPSLADGVTFVGPDNRIAALEVLGRGDVCLDIHAHLDFLSRLRISGLGNCHLQID